MPEPPCSRPVAKALRKQLTRDGFVADSFRELWTTILVSYQEEVGQIEALCRGLDGVEGLTSRVKTIPTLVEKLRRFESQQLFNVDNLAGCRIVTSDVVAQERLLEQLLEQLTAHGYEVKDLKDRRWSDGTHQPSEGYRAVHVIARRGWFRCEIQVRTRLQHQWAELFESVCDRWGRGPRYGEALEDGGLPASGETALTRNDVIALLQQVSPLGEAAERARQAHHDTQQKLDEMDLELSRLQTLASQEEARLAELTGLGGIRRSLLADAAAEADRARQEQETARNQLYQAEQSLQAMLATLAVELGQERMEP